MAFLIKNTHTQRTAGVAGVGQAMVGQFVHVARATAQLPQSTTEMLFRVRLGRVLVHLFLGEVTTVMTATDPILSFNCTRLSDASAVVGTTVVLATTATLASLEAGGFIKIEGDGTALITSNAGVALVAAGNAWVSSWTMPQGEIYCTTTANNTTGRIKWDMWYQPLDEGAYVEAQNAGTAII